MAMIKCNAIKVWIEYIYIYIYLSLIHIFMCMHIYIYICVCVCKEILSTFISKFTIVKNVLQLHQWCTTDSTVNIFFSFQLSYAYSSLILRNVTSSSSFQIEISIYKSTHNSSYISTDDNYSVNACFVILKKCQLAPHMSYKFNPKPQRESRQF